jgi:hypothetical protein
MAEALMQVDYNTFAMMAYMVTTSVAAAMWVGKLSTRVAVLEAGHDSMADLLNEIKADIKELVQALHGSDSVLVTQTKRIRKKP